MHCVTVLALVATLYGAAVALPTLGAPSNLFLYEFTSLSGTGSNRY